MSVGTTFTVSVNQHHYLLVDRIHLCLDFSRRFLVVLDTLVFHKMVVVDGLAQRCYWFLLGLLGFGLAAGPDCRLLVGRVCDCLVVVHQLLVTY